MQDPDITDQTELAYEIEHLVKLAQENDIPDYAIREVLESSKGLTED